MAEAAATMQANRAGGYRVLGRLGAGGMGVVYKAVDLKLNRTVALKFLAQEALEAGDKERLLREARAASALDHPNIATVHAVEEAEDGRLFIVMGYYEGETLAEKLRRGPLQPARAINIACQIARGLQHAHAHGVVHRDIKPSNVIITTEGVAKIVDFGLARHCAPSASTQTASLSGTLPYMSPEQAGGKALDGRTDIWSLGVVLYQMLTGRLPFYSASAASTVIAILQSPPAPLSEVRQDCQLVIYRALAKSPAARYQSCGDLLKDLDTVTAGDNQPTTRVNPHELHRQVHLAEMSAGLRPAWRHGRWIGALLVAVLVALLLAWTGHKARARSSGASATSSNASAISSAAYDSYLKGRSYLERYDRAGNLEAALGQFESAVKADPTFALGFAGLAEAYYYKYRFDLNNQWLQLAETKAKRALELNDQLPAAHVTSGRIHNVTNETELALQEFQRALKLAPHNSEALRGLASVYDRMGRRKDAEDLYREAIVLRPDFWITINELGTFFLVHGEFEKAAEQYRRATELTADNAVAHGNLALALDELGRLDEAETEFKKSIELRPIYAAYAMLGRFYYRQRRWAEAASTVEKALQLNSADYRVWANLASAYEWLGKKAESDRAYAEEFTRLKAAANFTPEDPEMQCFLGVLYARQQLPAKAIPHLEAALARAPDRGDILANAAGAYDRMGDRARALAVMKRALQNGLTLKEVELDPSLQILRQDPRFQQMVTTTLQRSR